MVQIDTVFVVCPRPECFEAGLLAIQVAGLPLLTRSLLSAQRAGIPRIAVVASDSQQAVLRRQLDAETRLRGRVRWLAPAEDLRVEGSPALILLPSVVLDAGALRRWLGRVTDGERVTATGGAEASPLVVPAADLPSCIEAALEGQPDLLRFLEKLDGDRRLARVPWEGGSQQSLRSAGEAPEVERAMLEALRSPEDGPVVDRYVNRALSGFLTRWLLATRVTPNQVTVGSLLTGLVGAWHLGGEGVERSLVGLILFQLSVVLDHVDGELARLKFLYSRLGKWLDNFSDHAVDLAVIAFLTWRAAEGQPAGRFIALGLAAALGVTGAFLVVFGWSLSGQPREVRTTATARLVARILAALANRDGFCLALWMTVFVARPEWFIWALALGANAYWIAWLFIYGLPPRSGTVEAGSGG